MALTAVAGAALGAPPALADNQAVIVVDDDYTPRAVAVKPGELVTWSFTDGGDHHNVHFDDNLYTFPDSPMSAPWMAMRTFSATGMYRYHCDEHGGVGGVGMAGVVYVNDTGMLPPNVAPTASFVVSPAVVAVNRNVAFDATTSSDTDGAVVKYEWDLDGNGSYEADTGTVPATSRSYATTGTRIVGLRVTDNQGATSETMRSVQVTTAPTAAFTIAPNPAEAGQTVIFDGSTSSKPGGSIATYEWDRDGNGSFETDTGTTPTTSRAYTTPGTLTVGLMVTDNLGVSAETTQTLQIQATPPPALVPPPPPAVPGTGLGALTPRPATALPRLTSTISYTAKARKRFTVLTALSVRGALAGSTVRLACNGTRCPFQTKTRGITKNASKLDLLSLVRDKKLRPGATLEIRVTRPGTIGVVRRLTFRAGKRPKSATLCLTAGATKASACPG